MLARGTAPPGAVGDPSTPHRVLRGVLQPRDKPPALALAQSTSGQAGYHLGLAMLCLTQWIQRRWPSTGTVPWIWAIPAAHTRNEAGSDTPQTPPPPPDHSTPSPAGTTPSTGSSAAWVLARSQHTPFPPLTKRSTKYASSCAKSLPRQQKTASFSSEPPGLQLTTQAHRCERTHTPTQHTPPRNPRPCPSPLAAHPRTHTRPPSRAPPGPATRASPTCPNNSTRPPRTHPPDTPQQPSDSTTRTHPPRGAPRPAARPPRPVARKRPPRTPQKTQANPPRPPNAARANCSPPRTPTYTASHVAGPRPSQASKERARARRLPPPLLPTRSARRAARSRPRPASHPGPPYSLRTCPPSSLPWQQQKPLPTNP